MHSKNIEIYLSKSIDMYVRTYYEVYNVCNIIHAKILHLLIVLTVGTLLIMLSVQAAVFVQRRRKFTDTCFCEFWSF